MASTDVDETVTSSLGPDQRPTPCSSLTSDDTLPLVPVSLVGTEHVSDLTTTNTDVTSGNIGELANMSGQLTHESIAETTDLIVSLALGVEVRTALATAHVDYGNMSQNELPKGNCKSLTSSQSILKGLLEAQELEDG